MCVPRDWFRGPKLTCTLGTHNVPQGLNTVQGIYVLRCACHMPSVFGRVDMWPCGSRCSHQARDERGTPCWAMVLLQWFIPYWIPWIPFIQFQQTWQWTDIWNIHEHTSLGLPLWISLIPDVFGGWRRTFGRTYSKRNICWKKWIEGLTSICYTVGWVYQVLLRAKQTMCDGQTPSCFHRKETITFGLWGKTLEMHWL